MKRLELRVPYRQDLLATERKAVRFERDGYAETIGRANLFTRDVPFEVIVVARAENEGPIFWATTGTNIPFAIYGDGAIVKDTPFRDLVPLNLTRFTWKTIHVKHTPPRYIEIQINNLTWNFEVDGWMGYYGLLTHFGIAGSSRYSQFNSPRLVGIIDYLEVRLNNVPVATFPIDEGNGSILHNIQGDESKNLQLVNGIWISGKSLPPKLYQPFELEVEP